MRGERRYKSFGDAASTTVEAPPQSIRLTLRKRRETWASGENIEDFTAHREQIPKIVASNWKGHPCVFGPLEEPRSRFDPLDEARRMGGGSGIVKLSERIVSPLSSSMRYCVLWKLGLVDFHVRPLRAQFQSSSDSALLGTRSSSPRRFRNST